MAEGNPVEDDVQKKNNIEFEDLISKYKTDNFKKMTMIKHQFLYSCINPLNEEQVLCLEKNIYPRKQQLYSLTQVEAGEGKPSRMLQRKKTTKLGDDDLDDIIEEKPDKRNQLGAPVTQKLGQGIGLALKAEPVQKQSSSKAEVLVAEKADGGTQGAPLQDGELVKDKDLKDGDPTKGKADVVQPAKEAEKQASFEFEDEKLYKEFKEQTSEGQYKYAISKWRINGGRHAIQTSEFGFNGCPANNKFYLSQDGALVYFIQSQKDEIDGEIKLKRVTILDVKTLDVFRVFTLSSENINQDNLLDTALWNEGKLLMLTYSDENGKVAFSFVDTLTKKQTWHFKEKHIDEDIVESKIKKQPYEEEEDEDEEEEEGKEAHDKKKKHYHFNIEKVVFKGGDTENVYLITKKLAYGVVCIFKAKYGTELTKEFFNSSLANSRKNLLRTIQVEDLDDIESFHANKSVDVFIIVHGGAITIANFNPQYRGQKVLRQEYYYYMAVQKNAFLSESPLYLYTDDQLDLYGFKVSAKEYKKYEVKAIKSDTEWDVEYRQYADIRMSKAGQIVVIGQPEDSSANIVVNYIENPDKYTDQDINITFLQEISEIKCNYPYVYYCKGNRELFVQSLHDKKKYMKLELEEVFICFIELTPQFAVQGSLMQNQSLAFLSQKGDLIHLNILEYIPNNNQYSYRLFKSKTFIKRSDIKYGSIVKAVLMRAERKEIIDDYVLVLQYRHQIIMKSFLSSKYQETIEKTSLVNVPIIYCPKFSYDEKESADSVFFLQKEGLTIKVQRLLYSKTEKQNITQYFDHKATTIYFFTKHEDLLYLMDESMQVKVLSIDEVQKKAKYYDTMDFPKSVKENWTLKEFENYALTRNTFYQGPKLGFMHSADSISKDYEFQDFDEYISCYNMRNGPVKLENVNSVMYVVEGLYDQAEEEGDDDDEVDVESVDVYLNDQQQDDQKDNGNKEEQKQEDNITCNMSEQYITERKEEDVHKKNTTVDQKPQFQFIPAEKDNFNTAMIYDLEDEDSDIVILFVPFVDTNKVPLVFDNKSAYSRGQAYEYSKIQRSSFVDRDENILVVFQDQYFILSKSGEFKGQAKFQRMDQDTNTKNIESLSYQDMKWCYMSNIITQSKHEYAKNAPYFLFYNYAKDTYYVAYLAKRGANFIFKIVRSVQSRRPKGTDSSDFVDYFNQVIVTDIGEVLQVQLNDPVEGLERGKPVFYLYKNNTLLGQNFPSIFSILQEREASPELPFDKFGYAFVGDYLFIKNEQKLQYAKIFEDSDMEKDIPSSFAEVNLILDSDAKILRLITTQNQESIVGNDGKVISHPHLVQIVFVDYSEEQESQTLYIATWDLDKNIEHSMLQKKDVDENYCAHYICKGINEKMNYMITGSSFYDLQFMLPMTFLQTGEKDDDSLMLTSINEHKISMDKSHYLGLGVLSSVYTGYTLYNLLYWQEISRIKTDELTPAQIHLENFLPRYAETSVFHKYATDQKFLKLIYDEIKKYDSEEQENPWKNLYFHFIYPNINKESPFDIAMSEQSPKCIELMLNMFIELDSFSISLFIKKHFSQLFQMGLEVFQNYLDICTFTNISMNEMKSIEWNSNLDEIFMDYHCSYVQQDFLSKITKSKMKKSTKKVEPPKAEKKVTSEQQNTDPNAAAVDDPEAQKAKSIVGKKKVDIPEIMLFHPMIKSKASEDPNESNMKRVEVCALEFDWIFQGEDADDFIERLAETDNDNLFTINSVRIIISFLWNKYFYRILYMIFIPFMIYILVFCVYVTYVYEMKVNNPASNKWFALDLLCVVIVCLLLSFFVLLELRQLILQKFEYFTEVWNLLDVTSNSLSIIFIILDLVGEDPTITRAIGAAAVGLVWIKLFYFLRLFSPTANMIRMIFECCYDMGSFGFVLALAMIAWGNVFFILDINDYNYSIANLGDLSDTTFTDPGHFIGEGNFLISFIYSFNMGLGNFQTDYEGLLQEPYLWILFLLEAIFLQIILLNLLISIMGDTFGRVTSVKEQSKLKEQCQMICENQFLLKRSKIYKNSKYIIVVKLEKAGSSSASWEGQVAKLKTAFSAMINESKRETKLMIDGLKTEMMANYRGMDQKFTENQNLASKNNQSIDKLTKDVKNLGDNSIERIWKELQAISQSLNQTNRMVQQSIGQKPVEQQNEQ